MGFRWIWGRRIPFILSRIMFFQDACDALKHWCFPAALGSGVFVILLFCWALYACWRCRTQPAANVPPFVTSNEYKPAEGLPDETDHRRLLSAHSTFRNKKSDPWWSSTWKAEEADAFWKRKEIMETFIQV